MASRRASDLVQFDYANVYLKFDYANVYSKFDYAGVYLNQDEGRQPKTIAALRATGAVIIP